ncbi:MAG: CPBP family intramembrane metalloprotease [Candidatus Eremiobacteraeota bacterium]|nr:CPBP family intramembrane metalloprotease [Candidatus Eremiobacteraeota bacterium]
MATRTQRISRAFTREDGRERIAIPFWRGVLYALGSIAIGFAVMMIALIVMIFAVVLITGNTPSMNPGHPVIAASEVVFYIGGGWFAWWGLRKTGLRPFRKITRRDGRAILLGIAALFLVRILTGVVLVLSNQTKHVQAGFEHFDVSSKTPGITPIAVSLAILSMVVIAPIVEEIVFRGLLFGALAGRLGILGSALITALLFGAVHGDPILFPSLVAIGFVAALAYAATGNLWVAIALHALNNSLGAIFLVATSSTKH